MVAQRVKCRRKANGVRGCKFTEREMHEGVKNGMVLLGKMCNLWVFPERCGSCFRSVSDRCRCSRNIQVMVFEEEYLKGVECWEGVA